MWVVNNKTPYEAAGSWVQDKDANKIWLVVIKATFDIDPDGSTHVAEEQLPVLLASDPAGAPDKSLVYESDLLGVKICTDVLVNGSAWAPGGRPASEVPIQLVAGPVRKRLFVTGDRFWESQLVGAGMTRARDFTSMPVTYERAYGGWDRSSANPDDHRLEDRNPVGTGFATKAEHCHGLRLPNVEYPEQRIQSWKQRPAPAGLNAIDCSWSPRRELAGTYDEHWQKDRFPLWAKDFDPRYRNCAPRDQQAPGFFKGGEVIDLVNLSRSGRLAFPLPRPRFSCVTRFGSKRVERDTQLCTVIVEPDVPRVMMAWQTHLLCNHRVDDLDETIVTERSH